MNAQKRSLYVFPWQLLRVKLDFATMESTKKSIQNISAYLERSEEIATCDLYKAVNLLAATAMGLYGQLAKALPDDDKRVMDLNARINMITTVREVWSELYAQRPKTTLTFYVDNYDRMSELRNAFSADILLVHKDLRKRWVQSHKRTYQVQRDELGEYLELLERELLVRKLKFTSAFQYTEPSIGGFDV